MWNSARLDSLERDSWLGLMREIVRVSESIETTLTGRAAQEGLARRLLFFLYELDEVIRSTDQTKNPLEAVLDLFRNSLGFSVFDIRTCADPEQISRCHSVGYVLKRRLAHPTLAAMVLVLIAERLRTLRADDLAEAPMFSLSRGAPAGSVQIQVHGSTFYCLTDQDFRLVTKEEWQNWCTDENGLNPLGMKGALSNYFYSWINALERMGHFGEHRIPQSKVLLWQELIWLNPQSTSLWSNLAESHFACGNISEAKRALNRYIAFHGSSRVPAHLIELLHLNQTEVSTLRYQTEPTSPSPDAN